MSDLDIADRPVEGDLTHEAPLWKNLLFMKNGRTVWAAQVHQTEAEARAAIPFGEAELARQLAKQPTTRVVCGKTKRHLFYAREYSHAIPLPWSRL